MLKFRVSERGFVVQEQGTLTTQVRNRTPTAYTQHTPATHLLSHLLCHLSEKESDRVQCQCCHSEVLSNLVGEGATVECHWSVHSTLLVMACGSESGAMLPYISPGTGQFTIATDLDRIAPLMGYMAARPAEFGEPSNKPTLHGKP